MTYEEFVSLEKGDTVEDKDGVLGKVESIDILSAEVWVAWENTYNDNLYWAHYIDINKY
ncbi:hypothetical protein BC6_00040 [Bacillus phage BC-6]|nr:hypothetical protein BC6_00040 [Bacillus phage BC-6]